jgi:hypothetical protein
LNLTALRPIAKPANGQPRSPEFLSDPVFGAPGRVGSEGESRKARRIAVKGRSAVKDDQKRQGIVIDISLSA